MALFGEWHPKRASQATRPEWPAGFYESALTVEERPLYRQARAESGLHGEVALLRLRLHGLLAGRADGDGIDDVALTGQVLRIVDLLVKALRAPGMGGAADGEQAALERALDGAAARLLSGRDREIAE